MDILDFSCDSVSSSSPSRTHERSFGARQTDGAREKQGAHVLPKANYNIDAAVSYVSRVLSYVGRKTWSERFLSIGRLMRQISYSYNTFAIKKCSRITKFESTEQISLINFVVAARLKEALVA